MATITESTHAGGFLVSEANGGRSRETITIASGENLAAGAVLGKINVGEEATATAWATNTGDGVMGEVTVGGGAKPGIYKLTVVEPGSDAGTFVVEDPDGVVVGSGVVASEFSGGGLTFTLADGTTDFVAGDGFDIEVDAGSGEYVEYDPTNTDGSQTAVAILFDAVDATSAAKTGVAIVRDAEVNASELVWFAGATDDQKTAGLAALAAAGIIGR